MRPFTDPHTNKLGPYPFSEEQAIEYNFTRWEDTQRKDCDCNQPHPLRWVGHPDSCVYCLSDDYISYIINTGPPVPGNPDLYWGTKPCKHGPHWIVVEAHRNGCYICREEKARSPRQIAKDIGRDSFIPDQPCPDCGFHGPVLITNSRCLGCQNQGLTEADLVFIREWGGTDLSREAAHGMGLRYFKRGGWRWVHTGHIIRLDRYEPMPAAPTGPIINPARSETRYVHQPPTLTPTADTPVMPD